MACGESNGHVIDDVIWLKGQGHHTIYCHTPPLPFLPFQGRLAYLLFAAPSKFSHEPAKEIGVSQPSLFINHAQSEPYI